MLYIHTYWGTPEKTEGNLSNYKQLRLGYSYRILEACRLAPGKCLWFGGFRGEKGEKIWVSQKYLGAASIFLLENILTDVVLLYALIKLSTSLDPAIFYIFIHQIFLMVICGCPTLLIRSLILNLIIIDVVYFSFDVGNFKFGCVAQCDSFALPCSNQLLKSVQVGLV